MPRKPSPIGSATARTSRRCCAASQQVWWMRRQLAAGELELPGRFQRHRGVVAGQRDHAGRSLPPAPSRNASGPSAAPRCPARRRTSAGAGRRCGTRTSRARCRCFQSASGSHAGREVLDQRIAPAVFEGRNRNILDLTGTGHGQLAWGDRTAICGTSPTIARPRSVSPRLGPNPIRPATLRFDRVMDAATWHCSAAGDERAGRDVRGPRTDAATRQRAGTQHARCPSLPGGRLRQCPARPLRRTGDRGRPRSAGARHRTALVGVGRRPHLDVRAARQLRWSNGERLDAAQVVASFRRAFAPLTAAPFAELFDALDNAGGAGRQAVAQCARRGSARRATVVFTLNRSASLPALLTLPIAFPVCPGRRRVCCAPWRCLSQQVKPGTQSAASATPATRRCD